ncbi:MAG: efflux RND transporter periplasmic adaptor subunit [Planctomycetes bacterium]|nr:efflux RND transporter periplasmic adaptor subunit [Planctomycetota bacterium]
MSRRGAIGTVLLSVGLIGAAVGLAAWKRSDIAAGQAAAASMPEPMESITTAVATAHEYVRSTTSIGTVRALRSVTLQNELPGTVREVHLEPGSIVEAGTLLVALDVAVEEAELAAQAAQAALAETMLGRVQRALENKGASEIDVDRAKAERDVALANVARTKAVIERKTLRAPFRARVGMSDVHEGQYLDGGTELTTLQGLDDAVHVDFAVNQTVAAGLREGAQVEVVVGGAPVAKATIVAVDARVDEATRNTWARARLDGGAGRLSPGASVRVRVPIGAPEAAVVIPVNALRKGPAGDHVYVVEPDAQGALRAHVRPVQSGALLGDTVLIEQGLAAGDVVAASGSFKLREGVLVVVAGTEAPVQ